MAVVFLFLFFVVESKGTNLGMVTAKGCGADLGADASQSVRSFLCFC